MKKRFLIISLLLVTIIFVIYMFGNSMALIENDSRVAPNSTLTYYIDVIYDGKDSEIVTSSDSAVAKVYSDYIYVEDKIPDGLTFVEFVTAEDGTIGAVKRSDGTSCPGYVVGDSEGLVYDSTNNTVSFKVKRLQAGCKLTVGIVTTTPSLNGETRKDFYNTAFARENYSSLFSNTVHVYMGDPEAVLYSVNYQYTGTVPDNAPSLPNSSNYIDGTTVGVENDVTLAGYTFSGWSTEDVTVSNGTFTMPSSNVTFVGSFTSKTTYQVNYSINGVKPSGYVAPITKSYGAGDDVVIDSMQEGDIVNGYRFLGWTSTGLDLSDGVFVMPSSNVSIVGTFEKVTYEVSYEFQGAEIPSNADSLLPETRSYSEGDIVTLASNPTASGYEFLGWYHEDNFQMPAKDVVIYGEWKVINGTFSPSIKKEIVNKEDYYHEGDIVQFKVTVTNNANYAIKDVLVKDTLDGVVFTEGTEYSILSDRYVSISSIAANSSATLNATYTVGDDVLETITNTAKITGAIADNNNELDTSREYTSSVEFNVSNITLTVREIDTGNNVLSSVEYTLYSDEGTTDEIGKGLSFELNPGAIYYLKESKAADDYKLSDEVIKIVVDNDGKVSTSDYDIEVDGGKNILTLIAVKENSNNNNSSNKGSNKNTSNNGITNTIANSILPKTGDQIIVYVISAIMSLFIIILLFVVNKRNKKK